ncbi:MAG: Xylose ABC transporter, periplasmic xylose-binding protein XylF [uncultured Phycisphaerae bacterium]|uniref:Xylose ABC transporter, periplasmic xylose-binding protein XylF n=1 Tax=uncultured Phycisphaerae bacterium TaxID=904963 RepID=A0A6J4N2S8_9BACT|nr:MAG: Xylose ABC transporter, periplasmic xylose-binding protein XylF [uncultured Phycisphaerae bacterium]
MRIHRLGWVTLGLCVAAALSVLAAGCDRGDSGAGGGGSPTTGASGGGAKPRVAYITNGVDPFWVIAEKGVQDGGREHNAEVTVLFPTGGPGDQKQKVEDLLVRGIEGIAISPIDAKNQTLTINQAAAKTNVITHDSDAPESNRLMYIGMDNYEAGRMAGQLVKEAVPAGGKVAIFIGRLEQDNGRLRHAGVVDELMDRPRDDNRREDAGREIKNDKFTIVATLTDQLDPNKAKSNAEDILSAHPDLACMIGLFASNPPMCLEALRGAGKLGKVAVVGFDEQDGTLQAIKDGTCHGTVVQNPYMYGKESVRVLAALARDDKSVIPENKFMSIPARQIRKDNVDAFWADLKQKTGK